MGLTPFARDRIQGTAGDCAASSTAVDDDVVQAEVVVDQCLLGLRRADEPHRDTEDSGWANVGVPQQIQQMEQRRRGVADRDDGTIEPVPPQLDRGGRTGVADLAGEVVNPWVRQQAQDLVACRQPPAGYSAGHHLHVAQDRGAGLQGGACHEDRTGGERDVVDQVHHAAGVDHPDGDLRLLGGKPAQVCHGPDHGEGLAIDLGAVPFVFVHRSIPAAVTLHAADDGALARVRITRCSPPGQWSPPTRGRAAATPDGSTVWEAMAAEHIRDTCATRPA